MAKRGSFGVAVALVLVIAGCGSSSNSGSTPTSTSASALPPPLAGNRPQATMKSLAFNPGTIHVRVGQSITWTNEDAVAHNITYVSGPRFKDSPNVHPGKSFTLKLTEVGTIHYYCTIHPFMKGTIVVSG